MMEDDELEFQEFMDSLRALQAKIFWALEFDAKTADNILDAWHDIKTYGDEPAFTSIIFERLVKEDE